jgi:uncharacterized protein (TIGR02145 family)
MKTGSRNSSLVPLLVISLMAFCGLFPTHCKKFEVTRQVIVKTDGASEITRNSCRVTGTLLDLGESGVSGHGFCWSLTPDPANSMDCNDQGRKTEKGQFSTVIENLMPGTRYYFWAYASEGTQRSYGDQGEFTTQSAQLPVVETGGIFNETSFSAECTYNVVSDGGAPVEARGVCWDIDPSPTIENAHTNDGSGTGEYASIMNELTSETTYYVRAYAANSAGIAYGNQQTFITLPEGRLPQVHTNDIGAFNHNSAFVQGYISSDGGSEISEKGFCWGTQPDPTTDNSSQALGSGPEAFEMVIEGLVPLTTYYIRAYAVNQFGTGYGEMKEVTTLDECGIPFVDERDNRTYQTVRIGQQCWMAQNLDFGVMINRSGYATDNGTPEKYCYGDDPANCETYGGLYSWDEMMQYNLVEGTQGVCPDGWHIPSDGEWKTLEMALGMTREIVEIEGWRGFNEGGKLKVSGIEFWDGPNEGATNESGFSALPAGGMDDIHQFDGMGFFSDFWTSSWNEPYPWYRLLNADRADIYRTMGVREFGTSVRCVKD